MPSKADLIATLDWTTERMSNRVWALSAGVLATSLTYIIESTKKDGVPFLEPRYAGLPAVLALIAMGADLAQYYAASRQNIGLLDRMEREKADALGYDRSDMFFRLRFWAYNAKICACVAAALTLVVMSATRVYQLIAGA